MFAKHNTLGRLAVVAVTAAALTSCGDSGDANGRSAAMSLDTAASAHANLLEKLEIRDFGEVESAVNLGDGLTLAPNDGVPAITTADVADILRSSGVWLTVTNGTQQPITNAETYEGRISEKDFEQVTLPGTPEPALDVAEPPTAVKDRPAVVAIFKNVRWMGVHGGGGPAVAPDSNDASRTPETFASQDVLVAFDANTSELIFLRTLGPVE